MLAQLQPFFRRRSESIISAQHVILLDAAGKKPKPRVAVVAAPLQSVRQYGDDDSELDLTEAVLYVLALGTDNGYTIKHTLPVRDLSKDSPSYPNSTDAQYDVSSEGGTTEDDIAEGVRLSFESGVQRDSITAAISRSRRALADEAGEEASSKGHSFGGPVSIDGGGASYGRVVRKKRDDSRSGVLQPDDELYLAREAKAMKMSLSDVKAFEKELRSNLALKDVEAINLIIAAAERWADQADEIRDVLHTVEQFEDEVRSYSYELLSRKGVIEEIEAESTLHQRVKKNLGLLIQELNSLKSRVEISKDTVHKIEDLAGLQEDEESLRKFFDIRDNVDELKSATGTMKEVLETPPPIVIKYSEITAVADRAETFTAYQLAMGSRAAAWIEVEARRRTMELLHSTFDFRRSTETLIVLLPPNKLFENVAPLQDIITVFRVFDYQRFAHCVRLVCNSMRSLYTLEIRRFFKFLRLIVRRVGWKGSLSISDATNVAGASRVKRLAAQGELTPVGILTPARGTGRFDDGDSAPSEANPERRGETLLPAEFKLWPDNEAGVRLLKSNARYTPPSAYVRKRDIVAGFASTGYVRPDLAWAAALKATSDLVFLQRNFFARIMGVRSKKRAWQLALELARDRGSTATEETILSALPMESRDETELPHDFYEGDEEPEENPLEGLNIGRSDELNTALWECFSTVSDTRPNGRTLLHHELVHTATVIANKCDGLCLLPCLAATEKMLYNVDDGDSVSSAKTYAMHRRQSGDDASTGEDYAARNSFIEKRSGFYTSILVECYSIMRQAFQLYNVKQREAIDASALANVKSPMLMEPFSVLPVLLSRLETMLNDFEELPMERIELFLKDLVQHLFEKLDDITIRQPGDAEAARHYAVFKQYLHHAFFAAVVQTTITRPAIKGILADFFNRSKVRRDHYEAIYIASILFPDAFPKLSTFMNVADDARRMFESVEELACHSALKENKVRAMADALDDEIRKGAKEATKRLKGHFARAVPTADPAEDLFFRVALPVTFDHLKRFVNARVDAFRALARDLGMSGFVILSSDQVDAYFDAAER